MIRLLLPLLVCAMAWAQLPTPSPYKGNIDPVTDMTDMGVAGVDWTVDNPDQGFQVRGRLSGVLSRFYQAAMVDDDFTLRADADSLDRYVQPGDWISVMIEPQITGGPTFQWQFFTGGISFYSDSLADLVDVQPIPPNAGGLTTAHTIDYNNDHLPDLALIAGNSIHFYTTGFCPSEAQPGRLMNWTDSSAGLSNTNEQDRLYFIFDEDFNQDGLPDLLLFNRSNVNEAFLLINESTTGEVRFSEASTAGLDFLGNNEGVLKSVRVADVTRDGKMDVVILWERQLQVYPGTGLPLAPFDILYDDDAGSRRYSHATYISAFEVVDLLDAAGQPGPDGQPEILAVLMAPPSARTPTSAVVLQWEAGGLVDTGYSVPLETNANGSRVHCDFLKLPWLEGEAHSGGANLLYHEQPGEFHRLLFSRSDPNLFDIFPSTNAAPFLDDDGQQLQHALGSNGQIGLLYKTLAGPVNNPNRSEVRYMDNYQIQDTLTLGMPNLLEPLLSIGSTVSVGDFDMDGDQDLLVVHEEGGTGTWEFHYLLDGGEWSIPAGLKIIPGPTTASPAEDLLLAPEVCEGGTSSLSAVAFPFEVDVVQVNGVEITSGGDPEFLDTAQFRIVRINDQPYENVVFPLTLDVNGQPDSLRIEVEFTGGTPRLYATKLRVTWQVQRDLETCHWSRDQVLMGESKPLGFAWDYIVSGITPQQVTLYDYGVVCSSNTFPVEQGCPEVPFEAGCVVRDFQLRNTGQLPLTVQDLVVESPNRMGIIPFCPIPIQPLPAVVLPGEALLFTLSFCSEPGDTVRYLFEDGIFLRAGLDSCGTAWDSSVWADEQHRLPLQAINQCDCPQLAFTQNPLYEALTGLIPYPQATAEVEPCAPGNPYRTQLEIFADDNGNDLVIDSLFVARQDELTGEWIPVHGAAFCFQDALNQFQPFEFPLRLRGGQRSIDVVFQPEEDPTFPCGPSTLFLVADAWSCGADVNGDGLLQPESEQWVPDQLWWTLPLTYVCNPDSLCLQLTDSTDYDNPLCGGVPGLSDTLYFNLAGGIACESTYSWCLQFHNSSPHELVIQDWSQAPASSMFLLEGDPQFRLAPLTAPLHIPPFGDFTLQVDYLPTSTSAGTERHEARLRILGGPACPADLQFDKILRGHALCPLAYPKLLWDEGQTWFPGDAVLPMTGGCQQQPFICDPNEDTGELLWTLHVVNPADSSRSAFTVQDLTIGDNAHLRAWVDDGLGGWTAWEDLPQAPQLQVGESLAITLAGCWPNSCSSTVWPDSLQLEIPEPRYDTPQYAHDEPIRVHLEASIGCAGLVEIQQDNLAFLACGLRGPTESVCDVQVPGDTRTVRLRNTCELPLQVDSATLPVELQDLYCVTILDPLIQPDNFTDNIQLVYRPRLSDAIHDEPVGLLTLALSAGAGSIPPGPYQVQLTAQALAVNAQVDAGPVAPGDSLRFQVTCPDRPAGQPIDGSLVHASVDLGLAVACAQDELVIQTALAGDAPQAFQVNILDSTVDGPGGSMELDVWYCPERGPAATDQAELWLRLVRLGSTTVVDSLLLHLRGTHDSWGLAAPDSTSFSFEACGLRLAGEPVCAPAVVSEDLRSLALLSLCDDSLQIVGAALDPPLDQVFCLEMPNTLITVDAPAQPQIWLRYRPQATPADHAEAAGSLRIQVANPEGQTLPTPLAIPLQARALAVDLHAEQLAADTLYLEVACPDRPLNASSLDGFAAADSLLGLAVGCAAGELQWRAVWSGADVEQFRLDALQSAVDGAGGAAEISIRYSPMRGTATRHQAQLMLEAVHPNHTVALDTLWVTVVGSNDGPGSPLADHETLDFQACGLRLPGQSVCDSLLLPEHLRNLRLRHSCPDSLFIDGWILDPVLADLYCVRELDSVIVGDSFDRDHLKLFYRPGWTAADQASPEGYLRIGLRNPDGTPLPDSIRVLLRGTALSAAAVLANVPGDRLDLGAMCANRDVGEPLLDGHWRRSEFVDLQVPCFEGGMYWGATFVEATEVFFLDTLFSTVDGVGGAQELQVRYAPFLGAAHGDSARVRIDIYAAQDSLLRHSLVLTLLGSTYGSGSQLAIQPLLQDEAVTNLVFCPFRFSDQPAGLAFSLQLDSGPTPFADLQATAVLEASEFTGVVEWQQTFAASQDSGATDRAELRLDLAGIQGLCQGPLAGVIHLALEWSSCDSSYTLNQDLGVVLSCQEPDTLLLASDWSLVDPLCPWPDSLDLAISWQLECQGDSLLSSAVRLDEEALDLPAQDGNWSLLRSGGPLWLPVGSAAELDLTLRVWPGADLAVRDSLNLRIPTACVDSLNALWLLAFQRFCQVEDPLVQAVDWQLCGLVEQLAATPIPAAALRNVELTLAASAATQLPIHLEGWELALGTQTAAPGQTVSRTRFHDDYPNEVDAQGIPYDGVRLDATPRPLAPDPLLFAESTSNLGLDLGVSGFWPDWRDHPPDQPLALDTLQATIRWRPEFSDSPRVLQLDLPVWRSCQFPQLALMDSLILAEHQCDSVLTGSWQVSGEATVDASARVWLSLAGSPPAPFRFADAPAATHLDSLDIPAGGLDVNLAASRPPQRSYLLHDTLRVRTSHPETHWRFFGRDAEISLLAFHLAESPTFDLESELEVTEPACSPDPDWRACRLDNWDCRPLRVEATSPADAPFRLLLREDTGTGEGESWLEYVEDVDAVELSIRLQGQADTTSLVDAWEGLYEIRFSEPGGPTGGATLTLPLTIRVLPCPVTVRLLVECPPGPWEHELRLPVTVEISGGRVASPLTVDVQPVLTPAPPMDPVVVLLGDPALPSLAEGQLSGEATILWEGRGQARVNVSLRRDEGLDHEWVTLEGSPVECAAETDVEPFTLSRNVCTPNQDGHNDEICFTFQRGYDLSDMRVGIYTLGGVEVFNGRPSSSAPEFCWDGRGRSGESLLPGPYLYAVWIGGEVKYRGQVVLVK